MTGRSRANRLMLAALFAVLMTADVTAAAPATAVAPAGFDQSHAAWTEILQAHVKDGVVDYSAMRAGARPALARYLDALASVTSLDGWSRQEKMAFWINAYNAWTVERVLDAWPVKSIKKLDWPRGPWKKKFIRVGVHDGPVSLDWIEHDVLRARFVDPRVHAALVCASASCPALLSEAYVAARLNAQLEAQMRAFLGDPTKNRLDPASGVLWLSKIFDWYGGDFGKDRAALRGFVARYLSASDARAVEERQPEIRFLDYDWSLNGR
jgi:hypothetical protein